eukprot:gnl/TRDRNA2_/TRDRNA2_73387_c0_seq1.p2 gnl/TRDRNA2_/TRDRNA2_73387_c0~~gnl/TRDRNA2_/TRDRNA2_73387_c0_seq1.p2  ORF type:complete len:123 (+),score=16.42 gnl/TRDRNA2_/TRDRNA2_73387_c0_seq1:107-475(+)
MFKAQGLAISFWTFANAGQLDALLFMSLTKAARRSVCLFNVHSIATTAWAVAMSDQAHTQGLLLKALARAAVRNVGEFGLKHCPMILWASSRLDSLTDAWIFFDSVRSIELGPSGLHLTCAT